MTNKSQNDIPLAEMIQTLRQELIRAQIQGEDQPIRFELEKVELELKVVVKRAASGKGGIEVWVINAGGDYQRSSEESHTIKLTLNSVDMPTNQKTLLSGKAKNEPAPN